MSNPKLHTKLFMGSDNQCKNAIQGNNFSVSNVNTFSGGYYKNSNSVRISSSSNTQIDKTDILPSDFTICSVVKPVGWSLTNTTVSGGGRHTIVFRDNFITPVIAFEVSQGAGIRVILLDTVNPTRVVDVTNQSMSDGTFYHMAVSVSTTNNRITIYKDGALIGSSSVTVTLSGAQNTIYSIGRRSVSNDQWWNGDIATFNIYNTELANDEIRAEMRDKRYALNDII